MILAQKTHQFLGFGGLSEGSESSQITAHDRDLTTMAFQEALVTRGDDELRQLGREEPPQATKPLEVVDLVSHPLLQVGIPLSQLRGLSLDGVVVLLDPQQRSHSRQEFCLFK